MSGAINKTGLKEAAKKMTEIAQTHQMVRGIVVPRKWYYYLIDFHYEGPTSNVIVTEEASEALGKACKKVDEKAKAAKLEMRGAYAWPDGSLNNYIRLRKPADHEELKKIFNGDGIYLGSVSEITDIDILSGINFLTLEEKFQGYSREKTWEIIKARMAEKDAFYAEYYKARKECDTCKPGQAGCKDCMKLCRAAEKPHNEWGARKRPLNRG